MGGELIIIGGEGACGAGQGIIVLGGFIGQGIRKILFVLLVEVCVRALAAWHAEEEEEEDRPRKSSLGQNWLFMCVYDRKMNSCN